MKNNIHHSWCFSAFFDKDGDIGRVDGFYGTKRKTFTESDMSNLKFRLTIKTKADSIVLTSLAYVGRR